MSDAVLRDILKHLPTRSVTGADFQVVSKNGGNGNTTVGGTAVPAGKIWIVPYGGLRMAGTTNETINAWFAVSFQSKAIALSPSSTESISVEGGAFLKKIGIPRPLIMPATSRLDGQCDTIAAGNALILEYMYFELDEEFTPFLTFV